MNFRILSKQKSLSFVFLCLHCAAPVPAVLAQAGTRVTACPALLLRGIVVKVYSF
jgi:hypothetical protein